MRLRYAGFFCWFMVTTLWIAPVRGDDVALYLEQVGLDELLAVHLEDQLETATSQERSGLLMRLADIYARLLTSESDADRRAALEERGRRLVKQADGDQTAPLQLALHRASFQTAESVAERHRLRRASQQEVDAATATMDTLAGELLQARQRLRSRIVSEDRRLNRARGNSASVRRESRDRLASLHGQTTFLAAWAMYYQAWLTNTTGPAQRAEGLFEELLGLGQGPALPENVSIDRRSDEGFARCILGHALCRAQTLSAGTGLEWLLLLEHERTFAPLREQVPAWRLSMLLDEGDYVRAETEFKAVLARMGSETPLAWLRLVAAMAMEGQAESSRAGGLARRVVIEIARRGELGEVFDLAERFGVDALGTSGFAGLYVRGVLTYYEAREQLQSDAPSTDPAVQAAFDDARADLQDSLAAPDQAEYAGAVVDAQRVIAWCQYFAGHLLAARNAFLDAAAAGNDGEESLWMAIVCLDELVEHEPKNGALGDELAEVVARFLARYPSSPQAGTLVLRRVITRDEISMEAVSDLLAIPGESEVYESARRRAAQILYHLFHDAKAAERPALGEQFLGLARTRFESIDLELDVQDQAMVTVWLTLARRLLEVSLHRTISRPGDARLVVLAIDLQRPALDAAIAPIRRELTYRQLQLALLEGEIKLARELADALYNDESDDIWSRTGSRALFRWAATQWPDRQGMGHDVRSLTDLLVRYGERVLAEYDGDESAYTRTDVAQVALYVAEASHERWARSREVVDGQRGLALYRKLLDVRPRNARFLRAAGLLGEAMGHQADALGWWRTLVSGSPQGSAEWYEAKFHLVNLVSLDNPARSIELIRQHVLLHPDYGPDPWGERLRALERRLIANRGAAQPVVGEEDHDGQ